MTVQVRILGPNDAPVLERGNPGVFDGPVRKELAEEFLHDSRHHIAVATDESGIGCAEGWVATETGNAAARALYRGAGGVEAPESIVMYTFPIPAP